MLFSIKGSLTLTNPTTNSGDTPLTWFVSEQKVLTWNYNGAGIGNVNLSYSLDGGTDLYPNTVTCLDSDWTTPVTANATDGQCRWQIPNNVLTVGGASTAQVNAAIKVKIASVNDGDIKSTSAQPLKIKSRFTNFSPDAGANWTVGDVPISDVSRLFGGNRRDGRDDSTEGRYR